MIKKLKTRFIVLAMVSLTVLLSLIVAGMNIANYRNVVSDADKRIEVLEENSSRLLDMRGNMGTFAPPGGFEDREDIDTDDGLDEDGQPHQVARLAVERALLEQSPVALDKYHV